MNMWITLMSMDTVLHLPALSAWAWLNSSTNALVNNGSNYVQNLSWRYKAITWTNLDSRLTASKPMLFYWKSIRCPGKNYHLKLILWIFQYMTMSYFSWYFFNMQGLWTCISMAAWNSSVLTCCILSALLGNNIHAVIVWLVTPYSDVINHRRLLHFPKCWFGRRSKETSKLSVTGHCVGNPLVTGGFPAQRASNAEMVTFY